MTNFIFCRINDICIFSDYRRCCPVAQAFKIGNTFCLKLKVISTKREVELKRLL